MRKGRGTLMEDAEWEEMLLWERIKENNRGKVVEGKAAKNDQDL